jgi:predicted ester cyclase
MVKAIVRTCSLLLLLLLLLTACQPIQRLPATQTTEATATETSLEEANKALVKRVYDEIMNQKNLSVAGDLFAPDMVIHQFDPAGEGLDLGLLITALPDLHVTIDRLLAEGDMVTALVTFSGTHQAEFLGVAPTGNLVTFSLLDLQRVQNGKIVEVWHNVPLTDILHQMQSGPNVITGSGAEPSATAAELIRTTERERLRAMVEADMDVAEQLHADDFQLIHPGGGALSKEEFLGDVASGFIDFVVWEPTAEIAVRLYGTNTAVIRYQSLTDIVVAGEQETVNVWHTDLYEKRDGQWQIVWEQSTAIQP